MSLLMFESQKNMVIKHVPLEQWLPPNAACSHCPLVVVPLCVKCARLVACPKAMWCLWDFAALWQYLMSWYNYSEALVCKNNFSVAAATMTFTFYCKSNVKNLNKVVILTHTVIFPDPSQADFGPPVLIFPIAIKSFVGHKQILSFCWWTKFTLFILQF